MNKKRNKRILPAKRDDYGNAPMKQLIIYYMTIFLLALSVVGLTGYSVAKSVLDEQKESILMNCAVQARDLIAAQYALVEVGALSEAEAQEQLKILLMGEMGEDGIRANSGNIQLGGEGYIIIYDLEGNEVLHPTLEGQNVWDATSFDDDSFYVVREQIQAGLDGGGFVAYKWLRPYSVEEGRKLSYCVYEENWEWVICATSYTDVFAGKAGGILATVIVSILMVAVLTVALVGWYTRGMTLRTVKTPNQATKSTKK